MTRILRNANGQVYIVLEGTIGSGGPAILRNLSDPDAARPYVVCRALGDDSWWHGSYHATLSDAFNDWQSRPGVGA